jgi:hypothetical protein
MPTRVDLVTPLEQERLGARILNELSSGKWDNLNAAVAYVKMSGVRQIGAELFRFSLAGRSRFTVGIDQQGSSLEGVQTLWQTLGGGARTLYILNNPSSSPSPTFHPKVWLFSNSSHAVLITGSGNLTGGGLFTNYEFGSVIELDRNEAADSILFARTTALLDQWADDTQPEVVQIDPSTLSQMHKSGELPSESALRSANLVARAARAALAGVARSGPATSGLFRGSAIAAAPTPPGLASVPSGPVSPQPPGRVVSTASVQSTKPSASGLITPQAIAPIHQKLFTQVNPRKKTEIYLAQAFLKQDPVFFGWPFLGLTTPKRPGNPGQPQPDPLPTALVTVFDATGGIAGSYVDLSLKLWTYSYGKSANEDFRMTLKEGLHKLVVDGSVLVMESQPSSGYDFEICVYPPGHGLYPAMLMKCSQSLPGGRRFGWT